MNNLWQNYKSEDEHNEAMAKKINSLIDGAARDTMRINELSYEKQQWEKAYHDEAIDHATTAVNMQKLIDELEAKLSRSNQIMDAMTKTSQNNAELSEKVNQLKKELAQQRFSNEHNLSIDQKVADRINELENNLKISYESYAKLTDAFDDLNVQNNYHAKRMVEYKNKLEIAVNALETIKEDQVLMYCERVIREAIKAITSEQRGKE